MIRASMEGGGPEVPSSGERFRWMLIDGVSEKSVLDRSGRACAEGGFRRFCGSFREWKDDLERRRDSVGVSVRCGCGAYAGRDCDNELANLQPRMLVLVKRRRETGFNLATRMAAVFVIACLLLMDTRPTSAAFNNGNSHGIPRRQVRVLKVTVVSVTTVPDPEFVDEIGNITVPAGRNVKLACSVKDLGPYKVAWMLFDKSAILTVQSHVITRNPRISVTHDKHRTWFLHIKDVREDDKGKYMCQINTATAKTQYGYLHVVVPPNIEDYQTSSDVIVREGANVTLTCKATGSPKPSISWKRDDGSMISINKTYSVMEWEGEMLEITRISRLDMGVYLCIATNGVPPTVSKQIRVSVDFPPMLWIPHQLVGAPLDHSVTLECYTEAHPTSLNYWTREDGLMIQGSNKYKTTSTPEKPSYKTHMTLTIHDLQEEDYGSYKCVAKNPRGETDGTIRLYMSSPPSTSPSPSTTEISKKDWELMAEMNNSVYGNPSSLTIHNEKNIKADSAVNMTTTELLLMITLIAVSIIR
ncbi:lachesin isoform X3 [Apis mellifera]|uniref:Lachesin isoform X3 n=1 Tax=Apis mellifera TaxID=7460 RepID=A0A7M7LMI7_APIME|nr:lachesin isoform X3 [Apis mellifera]|eukprot:XP_006560786.2 lachesin isoform X3 [Apis mellifera]